MILRRFRWSTHGPHMQQLFGALQTNQAETNRFFGVIAGTVPVHDFFAPDNLDRIMRAA